MKYYQQIAALLACIIMVQNASAQNASSVKLVVFSGTTDTVYNGTTLVLYNKITDDHDSVVVKNGKFQLAVQFREPTRYLFYSKYELKKKGGYSPFGIIVTQPGTFHLKADMESFGNTIVTNAPENALYLQYIKGGEPMRNSIMTKLANKYGADFQKHLKPQDPQYAAISKFYNELNEAGNQQEAERLGAFIKLHPNTFTSMYLLSTMITVIPEQKASAYYSVLGPTYKNTSYASKIVKAIAAKSITSIGKPAPDFTQPDTAGNAVKLSDFRGKYVLLDFWASWCIPCREENPNVVSAYQKYHDKGFTVLSVSLDQPGKKAAWLNAVHQDGLNWTQVSDLQFWNNAAAKLYGIQAIPQNFLIDKEGKIIAVNIKGDDLQKTLTGLFQ